MKNCGWRVIDVQTTCGPVPVQRRRYRCERCGRELYPADAQICCGRHRVTRPLAQRVCQLATTEHFPRLPGLIADQHGLTLSHETILQLAHDVGGIADRQRLAAARWSAQRRIAPPAERPAPRTIYVSCDGIMYCTGTVNCGANGCVYGSVITQTSYGAGGTPEVFYNSRLKNGLFVNNPSGSNSQLLAAAVTGPINELNTW